MYDFFFESRKPVFRMIFIVVVVTFTTLIINIIQGDPILQNIDFTLLLIGMYGYIFLLQKYIHQIWLQFLISFIAAFLLFKCLVMVAMLIILLLLSLV